MSNQSVTLADLHQAGAAASGSLRPLRQDQQADTAHVDRRQGGFARPDLVTPEMDATIVETAAKLRC